jgi:hypothetical protein
MSMYYMVDMNNSAKFLTKNIWFKKTELHSKSLRIFLACGPVLLNWIKHFSQKKILIFSI